MQASEKALNLIRSSEGLKISVYKDATGKPTIGYGHLLTEGEHFQTIDRLIANNLLLKDVAIAVKAVNELVKVPLNQNQFDALVDFVFNLGALSLKNSTLLRVLNQGDYSRAATEFGRWIYADGKILPGLINRREKERELFLTPC